MIMEPKLV